MDQVIGQWRKQFSNSKKKFYWFNQTTGQSLWADDSLPQGWGFEIPQEGAEPLYVHLSLGTRQAVRPTAPAAGMAPPSAPAAQISFQASQTAGDDLQSTAYVPDPHDPSGPGMNIPEKVRSKRDYLLGYGIPEGDRWNLQVDDVALYSITEGRQAERMTEAIVEAVRSAWARHPWHAAHVETAAALPSVQPLAFTITDATAAVGGNVLSFARHPSIRHVHAIELSAQRAAMCAHNAHVSRVNSKVSVHQGDSIATIQHASWATDVIFMDPPWGGPAYASAESLDMFLGPTDVSEWSVALTAPGCSTGPSLYEGIPAGHVKAKFVAIKAPLNYNVEGLRQRLAKAGTGASIVLHQPMRKMQLLIVQAADSLKLYTPQAANKRQRDENDGEAVDGHDSKRGKIMSAGLAGSGMVGSAVSGTGSTSAAGGVGSSTVSSAGAHVSSTSTAAASLSSGSSVTMAAFELLVRSDTAPFPLQPSGLFLRPSQSQGKMVLQQGMQSLVLAAAEVGMSMNIPGAPVLACASGLQCRLTECCHTLVNGQGCVLSIPAGHSHRLVEGQPLTCAAMEGTGNTGFAPCMWRLHASFDVERSIFDGSVPSAIMNALCLPALTGRAVAGEGERGRVSRGLTTSSVSQVLKVQPMDERVADELRLLSVLLRGAAHGEEATSSQCSALCTPTAVIVDRGRWANNPATARCLYVQADAGRPIEEFLPACGGRVRLNVAIPLFKRMLAALDYLHKHDLLHADVHAGNVLVPPLPPPSAALTAECAEQAQLIDLGSMRLLTGVPGRDDEPKRYRGKSRGGRWDIMAPEQFGPGKWGDGEVTLTAASDVYAAAATTCHVLLGYRPFNPAGVQGGAKLTVDGCKNAPLRDPTQLSSALRAAASSAGESEAAIERFLSILCPCLQVKAEDRPQSAAAVLQFAQHAL